MSKDEANQVEENEQTATATETEQKKPKNPFDDVPTTTVGENLDAYAKELDTPLQSYQNSGTDANMDADPDFVEHKGPAAAPVTSTKGAEKDDNGIKPAPTDTDEQKKDRRWRLAVKITSLANRLFPSLIGWMHDEDPKNFKADADDQKELSIAHYELLQPYESALKDAYGPIFTYIMVWGMDIASGIPNTIKKLFGKFKKKEPQQLPKPQPKEPAQEAEQIAKPPITQPQRPVMAERLDQQRENEAQRPAEQVAPPEQTAPADEAAPQQPERTPLQKLDADTARSIEELGDKIAAGEEDFTANELQLQANYPTELEEYLQRYSMNLEDSKLTEQLTDRKAAGHITVCKCGCGAPIPEGRSFVDKKHSAKFREAYKRGEEDVAAKNFTLYQTPEGKTYRVFDYSK